jgi:putative transposase
MRRSHDCSSKRAGRWGLVTFRDCGGSLGLAVPAKMPKGRRQGVSTGLPTQGKHGGHVRTWDFVHDTTRRGGKLRMLNIIDEYTRECLCIHVDRQINARKVKKIFSKLIDEHGAPEHIRSDNGSEFIERSLREWIHREFQCTAKGGVPES